MKIVYVSTLCSKKQFSTLYNKSKKPLQQQIQKYHKLIVDGFSKNNDISVQTISALPITRSNSNEKYLKGKTEIENDVIYNYLPTINLPIIKHLLNTLNSFYKTARIYYEDRDIVVICDVLNISVCAGALLACKILNIKNIGIVTDIPNFLSKNNKSISVKINNYIMNNFESYIFLTEHMKNIVNCKNKKYTVIEGQVDINMNYVDNRLENKYDKKVCIYAGGIHKIYGIDYLVEAFIKANIANSELHIYGSGDYEEELIEICNKNLNVKYFGVKPNDYIVNEELKSSLLINPRPTIEEYTKYSFPSKNMEYMVSGTPVLTTKLPGMPKEYDEYVYLIEDETVEGLSRKLKEVLEISKEELHKKGELAKRFVLENKNNIVQAEKIIHMIGR